MHKQFLCLLSSFFYKALFFDGGSIGGLFLLVKGYDAGKLD